MHIEIIISIIAITIKIQYAQAVSENKFATAFNNNPNKVEMLPRTTSPGKLRISNIKTYCKIVG